MFPENFDENSNLEDISTSIPSTDYTQNTSILTSVDHTNVYSSSTSLELMNCSPSTSTCSVSEDITNRHLPYTKSKPVNSALSTSFNNHSKYGTYQPMNWTNEVKLYSLI